MGSGIHKYASLCIILLSIALAAYFSIEYLLFAVLPFVIAWGVAMTLRPIAARVSRIVKVNERLTRLLLSMLASGAFISLSVGLVWYVVNKSWQFLSGLDANDEIVQAIGSFLNGGFFSKLIFGNELSEYIKMAIESVGTTLMKRLADVISGVAVKLPSVFIFMIVTIISAAYFAYDLEGINAAVKSVLPNRALEFLNRAKAAFTSVGVKYIRSYFSIMGISFITLFVGLAIIGVDYAALIALFVAVLDILPVFGIGTVLIPWSIIGFIIKDLRLAVGLLVLFLFITVLREIVEPKILGKNLGLHPLLTLVLLYAGYSFFGFLGMLLLPPIGALCSVMIREK